MIAQRDDGYILASAIGVLLAISIVAATLIGASGESIRRIRRAETSAIHETTLQSALALIASQLVLDPRRRMIDLSKGEPITVLGQSIKFQIVWESNKIDVNLASIEAIEGRLRDSGLDPAALDEAITAIRNSRATGAPIHLLTQLKGDQDAQGCLSSLLTIFGGQSTFDPALQSSQQMIGRPPAGSRLAIDLGISGSDAERLSTVILLTGDPLTPWQVMDWRRLSGHVGESCNAT